MDPKFCWMLYGHFTSLLDHLSEDEIEAGVIRIVLGATPVAVGRLPSDGSYVFTASRSVAAGKVGPAIF